MKNQTEMRSIRDLSSEEARGLRGLLFDLDDTFLDGTRLTREAYCALCDLAPAGLEPVAITGRPSDWGAVLARQWPVAGVISENGAISDYLDGGRWQRFDPVEPGERRRRSERLANIVARIRAELPGLEPADDVAGRLSDFTFDIGEYARVDADTIRRASQLARAAGARVTVSSVHLHVTLEESDKASGAVRFLRLRFAVDPTACLRRFAFIGDSENDAACFAAFRTTIAVENLRGRPTLGPRFITNGARGAGFAEAVRILLDRRR